MFILKLYDRKGVELKLGDIVKISDYKYRFTFYCEITYLPDSKVIAPFHTFSFHSFEKVGSVPEEAIKSTEERYNCWYVDEEHAEEDTEQDRFDNYLMSWRECEHLLESCWKIELPKPKEAL